MLKQIALLMIVLMWCTTLAAQSLYVFIPTEIRASKLQQQIGAYCSGVEVTVFGRAKDFHNEVKTLPPSAILSLLPVIEHTQLFTTKIIGVRDGAANESYLLVSVEKELALEDITDMRIGVVDILGRKPMKTYVESLLKTTIKLKRVTKEDDLLPLISFNAVDGLFISASMYARLKSKSNLNLIATQAKVNIGLASAAHNDTITADKLKACLFAFDRQLNSTLGVDQWHTL